MGREVRNSRCGLVLGVRGDVSSLDVLHGDVLDVEADVVSGHGLGERLVVHLDGLDLGGQHVGGEGDDHPGLDDAGLNSAHGNCANTSDFVDILEGKSKRLVSGSSWRNDGIKSLKKSHTAGISLLPLHLPSLVPGHLVRGVDHVVSVPARDGDEGNGHWVVSDLLDKVGNLLLNLLKPGLAVGRLGGVHLVTGNNELLDTKGVGKQSMFSGLTILGDPSLELTSSRGNDQDTTVSLRCSSNHVLDEITMSRGINDGDIVLGGLKLPESNVNGDTSLTLGLQLVQDPSILEGSLARLR